MASKRQLNRAYGNHLRWLYTRETRLQGGVLARFKSKTVDPVADENDRYEMACVSGGIDAMQDVREAFGLRERPGDAVDIHVSREFVARAHGIYRSRIDHLQADGHFVTADNYAGGLMLLRLWHEAIYGDHEWIAKLFGFDAPQA